jgi:transposase
MTAALSVDLRERVVTACLEEGLTYGEAATHFAVGYASVSRWLRLFRETQQLEPKPLPGRTPRIDEAGMAIVRRLVSERPDATVVELAETYGSETGARLAPCIMHRALARLGLTRKKRQSMPRSAIGTMSDCFAGTSSDSVARRSACDASSSSMKAG